MREKKEKKKKRKSQEQLRKTRKTYVCIFPAKVCRELHLRMLQIFSKTNACPLITALGIWEFLKNIYQFLWGGIFWLFGVPLALLGPWLVLSGGGGGSF